VLTVSACGGGGGGGDIKLDGSPRVPDDEGVATEVTRERITLDGDRTYDVSDRLRSFSTYTLKLEPMLNRKGQYVQVGLDGDTVVWMAGVAAVVQTAQGPSVFYVGDLEEIDDGRAVFADGTVLRTAEGVSAEPGRVQARIDVPKRRVTELRPTR
jgi:nucleoid-associated protein YgaU